MRSGHRLKIREITVAFVELIYIFLNVFYFCLPLVILLLKTVTYNQTLVEINTEKQYNTWYVRGTKMSRKKNGGNWCSSIDDSYLSLCGDVPTFKAVNTSNPMEGDYDHYSVNGCCEAFMGTTSIRVDQDQNKYKYMFHDMTWLMFAHLLSHLSSHLFYLVIDPKKLNHHDIYIYIYIYIYKYQIRSDHSNVIYRKKQHDPSFWFMSHSVRPKNVCCCNCCCCSMLFFNVVVVIIVVVQRSLFLNRIRSSSTMGVVDSLFLDYWTE